MPGPRGGGVIELDADLLVLEPVPRSDEDLAAILEAGGCRVSVARDTAAFRRRLGESVPDVVLLCGGPGNDPRALLGELRERYEHLPVIVVTTAADASLVAEGMRLGAFDFIPRPVDPTRLLIEVQNATRTHRLMVKVNQMEDSYHRRGQFRGIVGVSPRMQSVFSVIESAGVTDVTVFITGPSGTGKELAARAIHDTSRRARHPFVAINCAAIPRGLLESELFGHEKGAFTGAVALHQGCCEQSDGGTLFLDEICEMDVHLQSKLLRFLQERRFHRLGGREEVRVDVRVLAATNRTPREEMQAGRLREDLYYRLNVVPLEMPAVRDRREDIPLLANSFLDKFSTKHGKYFYDFAPDAMSALISYDWPGNVREIENTIERVVVLYNASQVTKNMLPEAVLAAPRRSANDAAGDTVILPLRETERREIERALVFSEGNVARAARQLRIGQATLYRKIKKYGLKEKGR